MPNATARQTFREMVAEVAEKARAKLPTAVNGRIESAARLVINGDVEPLEDGSIKVGGSDPTRWYHLVGSTCTCTDFSQGKAPDGWCKHRIAAGIATRVRELLPQETAARAPAVETETPPPPSPEVPGPVPAPGKRAIPAHFLQQIQGQTFIKYAGLLQLAHDRGLQELRATWTLNDEALSLAHAVATFPFGTFEECGDSTPQNAQRVKEAWRRMSLTRAKARCLRDALALDLCSVEEME